MTREPDIAWWAERGVTVDPRALIDFQPMVSASVARQPGAQPPCEIAEGCVIGPFAIVYAGVKLGPGTFVAPHAQIREGCVLGARCVVGFAVEIAYDTVIGDDVRIVGNAHITGRARIGDRVFIGQHSIMANEKRPGGYVWRGDEAGPLIEDDAVIGAGAYINAGVRIGRGAVVAAMAVVTKDVPAGALVKGRAAVIEGGSPAAPARDVLDARWPGIHNVMGDWR